MWNKAGQKRLSDISIFSKKMIFALILVSAFAVLNAPLNAQAASDSGGHQLEWQTDENAFEYKVEIRNKATGEISSYQTENNSINIPQTPGSYEFRVTPVDVLEHEGTAGEWQSFTITKALMPEVNSVPAAAVSVPKVSGEEMSIPVNITNVTSRTKVQLVNAKTGKILDAKLVTQNTSGGTVGTEIKVNGVTEGDWKIRVTDASGKVNETKVLKFDNPWPEIERQEKLAEEQAKAEEKRLAEEKAAEEKRLAEEKAAEEKRLAEEKAAEEKRLAEEKAAEERRLAEEEAAKKAAEEQRIAEEKRRQEEEKAEAERQKEEEKRIAAEEKKKKKGELNLDVQLGGGAYLPVMETTLFELSDIYNSIHVLPFVKADISVAPIKLPAGFNLGFGLDVMGAYIGCDGEYLKTVMPFEMIQLDAIVQKKLIQQRLYLKSKLGMGVFMIQTDVSYGSYSGSKSPKMAKGYGYLCGQLGASLMWLPAKHFAIEPGVEFNMLFINGMNTGLVAPYLNFGVHL